jgi:acyl carrier protein
VKKGTPPGRAADLWNHAFRAWPSARKVVRIVAGRTDAGGRNWDGDSRAQEEAPVANERLEEQLKNMLVERLMLRMQPAEIADTDDLIEKWGLESVQLMEIVIGLEEVFGIQLGDDEFSVKKFRTITNIAAVVREKDPNAGAHA